MLKRVVLDRAGLNEMQEVNKKYEDEPRNKADVEQGVPEDEKPDDVDSDIGEVFNV
jgi:hypothetical protein